MKREIIEVKTALDEDNWVVYYRLDNGMSHPGRLYIKKSEACDELAAYVQAMRILEELHHDY